MSLSRQSAFVIASQKIKWTPVAPEFRIIQENGKLFAVFEHVEDAFQFDMMYPHVFKGMDIADYGGQDNAYYLGYVQ